MFKLLKLKYSYADFEPYFDEETMKIHHSKHHQAYVDNLNLAIDELKKINPSIENLSLEEIVWSCQNSNSLNLKCEDKNILNKIRNNGGGHLNHSLFWGILKPEDKVENLPGELLMKKIKEAFGNFEGFKDLFKQVALGRFGSGWAWLRIDENGRLIINSTPNQDFWDDEKNVPILGLDVWEHAYYLKYQNRRADYIDAFWNIVDWGVVEEKLVNELEKINADAEKENSNNQKRILYTDGSASPNPGPGGFAIIENGKPIFLGNERESTNIRMEGLAIRKALEILDGKPAEIWTDSEFWINVLTKWASAWKKSGWKKKNGEIKNLDIVVSLFELHEKSNAELKWLKGHAGHDFNEMADEWANRARNGEKI